jgi:16S rRNA (cytidine1402-2'-O)-methyltransferase
VTEGESGTLYVVSTPIGNMGDFSFRAVDVLRSVAAVLAEDTRHSRHLLTRYEVSTPMLAYHEHNEASVTPRMVERLLAGESLALVTDAGTPLVSDPGARLVRAAVDAGITVTAIPGASALLAALVASGIAIDRFTFFGFLGRERREAIDDIVALRHAAVIYEAPARVADTLSELVAAGAGERATVVARELTKQYEELRRGTLAALAAYYVEAPPRGEIVIIIDGASAPIPVPEETLRARVGALRAQGMSARDVQHTLTAEHGVPRNTAYRLAHE